MTKTMSGVVLTRHGGPEMLEYRTNLAIPKLAPGDVLIRVDAAGVNNTDINTRLAWYSKDDGAASDASWSGEARMFAAGSSRLPSELTAVVLASGY